jgi:AhpD family alkylhydroperoxidase
MANADAGDEDFHRRISRLPPLPSPLDPICRRLFDETRERGGHVLNLHIATAHAPRIVETKRPFSMALRNECEAPRGLRELAILRTGMMLDCPYELDHHIPLALKAGVTQAQIDALGDWTARLEVYDERQRALLAFLDEMFGRAGEISDATFGEMSRQFSPREIVELIYNATTYYGTALVIKSLRIETDAPHVRATPGKF